MMRNPNLSMSNFEWLMFGMILGKTKGITTWIILLEHCYFEMWPDCMWFMRRSGRFCLIWPITDGLACGMFLFPLCHSHNPSLRAEPRACSYYMLCFCLSIAVLKDVCSYFFKIIYCIKRICETLDVHMFLQYMCSLSLVSICPLP